MTPPGRDPDRPRAAGVSEVPDRTLVQAAQRGDRAALERLLRRHHDRLHLLCRRLCRDRGDAEDATQNALIAIVRGLDRYDARAEFSTWAYRVTSNACMDELRRRSRRPVPSGAWSEDDEIEPVRSPGRTAVGLSPDPADLVVHAEERSRLQEALDQLDGSFRAPVVLRDVAGMDYAEIAEILGLAPGTVRSRIFRGRAKLAQILELGNHADTDGVSTIDPS